LTRAEECFRTVIRLEPKDARARMELGNVLLAKNLTIFF